MSPLLNKRIFVLFVFFLFFSHIVFFSDSLFSSFSFILFFLFPHSRFNHFYPSTNINKVKHVRFIFPLYSEILCCFKFKEKNTQNSIPAESSISSGISRNSSERPKLTGTTRNSVRGGTRGLIVPVYIPERDFPAIPAGTERNSEHWFILLIKMN